MMMSEGQSRRRLGDFEIVRDIGRGGMGIVYEARQVSLNRKVALKVLAGSLGLTSKAVVRFRREAEAAAKLHHTNIVPIYATGEHESTHYYAMELVEGPSLNLVIRGLRNEGTKGRGGRDGGTKGLRDEGVEVREVRGTETESTVTSPLPAWVAETIAGEATPAPAGTSESTASGSSTTLTTGGGFFDNIARMMAEVANALDYAHNQGVIHRDIKPSNLLLSPAGRLSINDFGLARMLEQPGMTMTGEFVGSPLYMSPEQIAVGRAPLDHRTDIYSLGATLYELLTLEPPFPGQRRDQIIAQIIGKEPKAPRRHNKRVPVDLETICLKAMEKDPDRRYQTAGQMAEDLRRFVNRFAISAKRASPVARMLKWTRRRPAVATLIGLVIVVSAVAGTLAYSSHLANERARLAEDAVREEAGQHALDQALFEVFSGHYDLVEPWLEKAELADIDPARIRVLRGLVAFERGKVEEAIHHLELAVQQLPDSLGAHALLLRAYSFHEQFDGVLPLVQEIVSLSPVTPEDYVYGAFALGELWPERALTWLEDLAEKRPTPVVYLWLGRQRLLGLEASRDASQIAGTLGSLEAARTQMPDSATAAAMHFYAHLVAADLYQHREELAHRGFHLEEARKDVESLFGHQAADGTAHIAAAEFAAYQGRWDDAVIHMQNAVTHPSPWLAAFRWRLPGSLCRIGRFEDALTDLDSWGASLRMVPDWCRDRAFVAALAEGPAAAERSYREWLNEHRTKTFPCQSFRLRYVPFEIYCFIGRYEEAIRFSREYLAVIAPPILERPFMIAVQRFICGELTTGELLTAAPDPAERARAEYLIGLRHFARGDRTAASESFSEIERAGRALLLSRFPWAELSLDRMREDPTWPPWIPVKEEGAAIGPTDDPDERGPDDEESP